jgi:catechol 2,3-dioxygenase-like lactoylglutathione lyase family enzyme
VADDDPVFDQVNIITGDLPRSLDFYRLLGAVFPRPLPNSSGQLFHVGSEPNDGALLELDSVEFAPVWNAGWSGRADLQGRVVLGFRIATREGVDQRFKSLTSAGYRELQPPFDAFWGARYAIVEDPDRYAIVEDPDGIAIGLMSPIDPARKTPPPKDWTG